MRFPFILRPDQTEALFQLCKNDHLIYIAPTGSGKSILFQKYIVDHPKTRAVLISPLNALSRQLAERFSSLEVKTFEKNLPQQDDDGVWILSPEKIHGKTLEHLRFWNPDFLIVDEAHCIWEWGNRFRPSYGRVIDLVKLPSIKKSLWCSATLPKYFLQELENTLINLDQNKIKKIGSFGLPKQLMLRSEKISPEIRMNWLRNMLGIYADQSGIIFCNTRSSAVNLQKRLQFWGVNSFFYHAGLSIEEKLNLENQLKLQKESSHPVVVVATSAFGMGMDYSFFRYCILFEPPFTILSLVQAIGRIGRASPNTKSKKVRAHVLWHPIDFTRNRLWIDQAEVFEWCRTLDNQTTWIENYFNGYSSGDSFRSSSLD